MSKKHITKRILSHLKTVPVLRNILNNCIYFLLKILFKTYKLSITETTSKPDDSPSNAIYYFWHQNIIGSMFFFYNQKHTGNCIVSPSNDGKIAGFICKKLGFKVLYGSSYKQPITVLKKMISVLKNKEDLCIVGDGSRGPAFQLQKSIVRLAEKTSLPTIFVQCTPSSCFTFTKSWDQFQIPYPFSTIHITINAPKYHTEEDVCRS